MTEGKRNMELMNVEEAAAYLKFSTAFIYRLAKLKQIPHMNYGRRILFRKVDLYNWVGSKIVGYENGLQN